MCVLGEINESGGYYIYHHYLLPLWSIIVKSKMLKMFPWKKIFASMEMVGSEPGHVKNFVFEIFILQVSLDYIFLLIHNYYLIQMIRMLYIKSLLLGNRC